MRKKLQLIRRGELEPYFDGLQSRKRYAKFWKGVEYDPKVIKFQSTQTSRYNLFFFFTSHFVFDSYIIYIYIMNVYHLRTGASIMAFSEGLFNGKGPIDTCKSQPIYYWNLPRVKFFIAFIY